MDAGRPMNYIEVELVWGGDDYDYLYAIPSNMVKGFNSYSDEFGEDMAREMFSEFVVFDRHDWIRNKPTVMRTIYIVE